MSHPLNRRTFLLGTAAGAAALAVRPARSAAPSPNGKLRVGVVGVANRGHENLKTLATVSTCEVAALCDVDEPLAAKSRGEFTGAKFFVDFREMLTSMKDLDAVLVATPDHTHAPVSLAALRAGKHVYCEKPLTHTVAEARLLAEEAKKRKLVTQMGTQIHAGQNYRRVVELVQGGAIGRVTEAHVWLGKNTSWGGPMARPATAAVPPPGLNYDLWLGPVPERPYSSEYIPKKWRSYWAFGNGNLGDMGCHYIDLAFWALDLKHPTRVSAEGPPPNAEGCPVWLTATWDFPSRGERPPVKLFWYDGDRRPPQFETGKLPKMTSGVLFVGDKGMIAADYSRRHLLPEGDFRDYKAPAPTIPDSTGHHNEWVEACRNGGPTTCNFGYSGALTETVLLGTVAYRSGQSFAWDGPSMTAKGAPAAQKLLRAEYRKGWEVLA